MSPKKDFNCFKKNALSKFQKAKKENLIDKKIISLLDIINKSDNYFTTSSCAGRIVLLEIPAIGDKKNAVFLGKWHRKIEKSEFLNELEKAKKGQLWLLAQPPIIHVVSKTYDDAENLLKIGISYSFKNSGLKSIGKKIVIEICSTERFDIPIGMDGKLYCNAEYIELFITIANDMIERSNLKLERLEKQLKKKI